MQCKCPVAGRSMSFLRDSECRVFGEKEERASSGLQRLRMGLGFYSKSAKDLRKVFRNDPLEDLGERDGKRGDQAEGIAIVQIRRMSWDYTGSWGREVEWAVWDVSKVLPKDGAAMRCAGGRGDAHILA